jgi:hypothetical protein
MISDLAILHEGGQRIIEIVNDGRAGFTIYRLGRKTFDQLRGFVGLKQEENLKVISESAAEKIKGIPIERLSEPSPSVLTPLLEAACQESRTELQDVWAALLANSMLDEGAKVRREYLDVAKKLEPTDMVVLKILQQPLPATTPLHPNARGAFNTAKSEENRIGLDNWHVSLRALAQLGLIHDAGMPLGPMLTSFGRMFVAACETR